MSELIFTTTGSTKVGVDHLADGTYFVTITTEKGEQYTSRFVKL
ncbi:MAG: T9SS type A sorting domain-containing protein [Crocinitomicaceae bacterium]|nr:T9SS type A sorting domain-containing protein [Crocinitomicaceae bacterium]